MLMCPMFLELRAHNSVHVNVPNVLELSTHNTTRVNVSNVFGVTQT